MNGACVRCEELEVHIRRLAAAFEGLASRTAATHPNTSKLFQEASQLCQEVLTP